MLSEDEIRQRLADGKLSLFPLDEADIGPTGIALRLGGDFAEFPRYDIAGQTVSLESKIDTRPRIRSVELGDHLRVPPGEGSGLSLYSDVDLMY
jgi:hypothetical protein